MSADKTYFVDKIHRMRICSDGFPEFLIKWEGYPEDEEDTWERSGNMVNCDQVLLDFKIECHTNGFPALPKEMWPKDLVARSLKKETTKKPPTTTRKNPPRLQKKKNDYPTASNSHLTKDSSATSDQEEIDEIMGVRILKGAKIEYLIKVSSGNQQWCPPNRVVREQRALYQFRTQFHTQGQNQLSVEDRPGCDEKKPEDQFDDGKKSNNTLVEQGNRKTKEDENGEETENKDPSDDATKPNNELVEGKRKTNEDANGDETENKESPDNADVILSPCTLVGLAILNNHKKPVTFPLICKFMGHFKLRKRFSKEDLEEDFENNKFLDAAIKDGTLLKYFFKKDKIQEFEEMLRQFDRLPASELGLPNKDFWLKARNGRLGFIVSEIHKYFSVLDCSFADQVYGGILNERQDKLEYYKKMANTYPDCVFCGEHKCTFICEKYPYYEDRVKRCGELSRCIICLQVKSKRHIKNCYAAQCGTCEGTHMEEMCPKNKKPEELH